MTEYEAGSITVNDIEVPIKVDDGGNWLAAFAGQSLSYDTRDKLQNRLATLTKKTKVTVDVAVAKISPKGGYGAMGITCRRGRATGIHGGNGNVLAEWDVRGQTVKEQVTSWGSNDSFYVGGDVTDEEIAAYNELVKAKAELVEKIFTWEKRNKIDLKKAVEAAIQAKAGQDE